MKIKFFNLKFKKNHYLVMFFLSSFLASSQYDFLMNSNKGLKKDKYEVYLKKIYAFNNESLITKECERIKNFAIKNNVIELELELDFEILKRKILNNKNNFRKHSSFIIRELNCLITKAHKNDFFDLKARIILMKSKMYWLELKNYELAFETYYILDKELTNSKSIDINSRAICFQAIASAHSFFNDYPKALYYYKKAISTKETEIKKVILNKINTNIGNCYCDLKKLDSAEYYYKKLIKDNADDELWIGYAKGGLGYVYYLSKNYERALPLLEENAKITLKFNDILNSSDAFIMTAEIFTINGGYAEAKKNLVQAEKLLNVANDDDSGLKEIRTKDLYLAYSNYYRKVDNKSLALVYLDSSSIIKGKINDKYNRLILARSEQKNILQKNRLNTQILLFKQRQSTNKLYLFLIVLFFLMIIVCVIYINQKRHYKKINQIQELKLDIVNKEKENAIESLNNFANKLIKQNEILELFEYNNSEKNDIVQQIKKKAILTHEDWEEFQIKFEKVHFGFLSQIKNNYKDLTPSEIRYLALTKLKFSSREMSTILGISESSVRVTLHRVIKKLGVKDKRSLEDIIENIN